MRAARSRPIPVSMFCFGSGVSVPSACSSYSMKTRFQNSRNRSQPQPGAHSARPQPTPSPQSKKISESGPHGPGPPTDQKLSARGRRTIRSGGIPFFSQCAIATWSSSSPSSGSPAKTLTQMRSRSSFMCSNMNSHARSIAPSLKYSPSEKLPSISKKVSVLLFRPTSSMSGVRKTFWTVVSSGAGGSSKPRKYGIRGCIPAEMRRVERSSARGISDAEGRRVWPLDSKKERNPSRSSGVVRTAEILRAVDLGTRVPELLRRHPSVRAVSLTGSRARGTPTPLSDWDFGVETDDLDALAADVPELLGPLEPLAQQWDPLGERATYMLMLRGPTKVDLIFLHERRSPRPRWHVST